MQELYEFDENLFLSVLREELEELEEKKKRRKKGRGYKKSGRKKKKKKSKGKKDACYHKVRSRYDVWPSAYASGALVKCRKVGAKNWGNKSKKNEGLDLDDNLLQIIEEEYRAVLDEKKRNARSVKSVRAARKKAKAQATRDIR